MIGLQYLLFIHNIKYNQLAHMINVSPVTISDWLAERRRIPLLRINQLSKLEIFKDIDKTYFQLQLSTLDLLHVFNFIPHIQNKNLYTLKELL